MEGSYLFILIMTRFQLLTFAFSPLSRTFELWVGSIARLSAVSFGRVRRFGRLSNEVIELSGCQGFYGRLDTKMPWHARELFH